MPWTVTPRASWVESWRQTATPSPRIRSERLPSGFGLRVREQDLLAQHRDAGGWCDGISFLDDGVVLYAPSPNSRRENFTLTHELGHKLAEEDDDALDWLANRDHPERDLERLCDLIAARLLLPDTLIAQILDRRPPEAVHIGAL
jgi:Zn-dependent peptidase ImmA (M78 family)